MIIKKLHALLGLLMLLTIGQTSFGVDPASAGHNCNRKPYHCFMMFGTYDEGSGVSNLSPPGSTTPIPVANSTQTGSGNPARKVFVYTDNSAKVEVEIRDDAAKYFKKNEKAVNERGQALGFMTFYQDVVKMTKPVLVDFFPADLKNPYPDITPEQALKNWIKVFENKFPKKSQ